MPPQASDVNPTLAARSVEGLARFFRSAQCVPTDTFLFSVIAPTPALKAKSRNDGYKNLILAESNAG